MREGDLIVFMFLSSHYGCSAKKWFVKRSQEFQWGTAVATLGQGNG